MMEEVTKAGQPPNSSVSYPVSSQVRLVAAQPSEVMDNNERMPESVEAEFGSWMLATRRRFRGRGRGGAGFSTARSSHMRQGGRDETITAVRSSRDDCQGDGFDDRHVDGNGRSFGIRGGHGG